ncbi:Mobile element protein [Richelia intracellularis]|nr:Mobile element protein [Richelia intracellularis]
MIYTDVGFDPGKQIHGRKRFITVDLLGLVLRVLFTYASVPKLARLAPARSGRFIR